VSHHARREQRVLVAPNAGSRTADVPIGAIQSAATLRHSGVPFGALPNAGGEVCFLTFMP